LWQRTREQELAVDGPAPRGHVRARAQHRAQRQTIAALAENGKTMREIVAATDLHASYVVRALAVEGFAAAQ
jgi:hypothetical protein